VNPILGIDLGTAACKAATVGLDGIAVPVADRASVAGEPTPTAVCFAEGSAIVGAPADAMLNSEQTEVATSALLTSLGDPQPLLADETGSRWPSAALTALLLRKVLADGETYLTRAVTGAVLATPDAAGHEIRKGIRNAAYLAGVPVLDIIDESVGVFLHYRARGAGRSGVALVCDFGASGFRCAVFQGSDQALASVTRPEAAVDRLDEALLERILSRAGSRPDRLPPRRRRAMLTQVRQLRQQLGRGAGAAALVFALDGRLVEGIVVANELRRLQAPLLEKMAAGITEALEVAEVGAGDVQEILLAGGFAEAPAVRSALETLFGRGRARFVIDRPREAAAMGAALRAAELAARGTKATLPPEYRGVSPSAVGVRVIEPLTGLPGVDVLVTQGMPLPCSSRRMYYTSQERQQRLVFELVGVEGKEVSKLGEITLEPLDARRRGHAIELALEIGLDGVMAVETYDSDSGMENSARFSGRSEVVDPATVVFLDRVRTANVVGGGA